MKTLGFIGSLYEAVNNNVEALHYFQLCILENHFRVADVLVKLHLYEDALNYCYRILKNPKDEETMVRGYSLMDRIFEVQNNDNKQN